MPRTKESGSLITTTGICRSMFTLRFQSSFQTNSIALSSQTEDILNASHVNIFITTDLRCHCHYYFGHYNILHHFVSVSPSSHVAQPTCFMAFEEPDHLDFIITAHLPVVPGCELWVARQPSSRRFRRRGETEG